MAPPGQSESDRRWKRGERWIHGAITCSPRRFCTGRRSTRPPQHSGKGWVVSIYAINELVGFLVRQDETGALGWTGVPQANTYASVVSERVFMIMREGTADDVPMIGTFLAVLDATQHSIMKYRSLDTVWEETPQGGFTSLSEQF